MRTLLIYFHTLKYLKVRQIYYRIYYFIRYRWRRVIGHSYLRKIFFYKKSKLILEPSIIPSKAIIEGDNFIFLNQSRTFSSEINWNDDHFGKLWTYNLNYFDFLHQETFSLEKGMKLIYDFIQKIEFCKDGLEPFPISLRVMNWIKFITYHQIEDDSIDSSLYTQLKILVDNLEYHLLGNHLLENGFALLFGAYYFEDPSFYRQAKKILNAELKEQLLADGGHFERSPMYHQIMLFRVLDCINLVKNNTPFNKELETFLRSKAELMLGWLKHVTFQNGDIALLNDSAFNIAPTTRKLFQYSKQLGLSSQTLPLKESGYRKIENNNYECIVDIGEVGADYIAGHAHSDTLSFILYYNKKPFIVDTGISTYNKTRRRQLERSTSSHNTVQIDEIEQTEIWGGFRVARRAYPKIIEDAPNRIIASHTGYARIGVEHTRSFDFHSNKIVIIDNVVKKNNQRAKAYLHFHPNKKVKLIDKQIIGENIKIDVEGSLKIVLSTYQYAFEFNQIMQAPKIIVFFEKTIVTTIYLDQNEH